ncbi:hypothetical protein AGABI2DRAFT_228284 [Agaricus bisporus var. bisporus H97]|uniref:hypothetical protein n=1 Tax=Agaricus bisporus var. bisporus (strain H97 / ATCC MYA-4626 / FGSC 10389) TaxID=936046 RepID=UPI00029F79BA|nr:hypothetical protein AGABI2DRAFT_228284 [Agaricus bisporus var. bisporus H97]EKV42676.1 hypothetical protein AGABI2DRAFT_228284 [Agaricus bisporus var. bisporus H97]
MPPLRPPTPSDDSESDAPETVTLTQSKKSSRKQTADIRKAEATVREKARVKNREKDRKLKERAASRKGNDEKEFVDGLDKGKGKGGEERVEDEDEEDLETRMLRAMNDAEDEESEGEREFEAFDDGSSFDDSSMDEDESEFKGPGDDDEEMSTDEADLISTERPARSNSKPNNYLPDELFQAAFSQPPNKPKNGSESNKKVVTKTDKSRKKASSSSKAKDILVGSRTVRTFQPSKFQSVPSTSNPSTKANKFLDRALGLKGQKLRRKGWERKPANIGILRRNGPAAHFVRNQ